MRRADSASPRHACRSRSSTMSARPAAWRCASPWLPSSCLREVGFGRDGSNLSKWGDSREDRTRVDKGTRKATALSK
eukprot:scaffold52946_cov53-Phaeocystis_antarctica.AAC.3